AALDGVFTDLRVRADSLPGLPDTVAANMNENGSKGWLAATLLIACALVFGVTLVAGLYRRLSRPGTQIAGNAGVLSKQAPSQSTPATVAFVCSGCAKSLVAKVALAGKTIKCPACGNATTVPAAEASLARQTPVAAAPRRPLWKRWQLWGALVLGVVFLACGMLVAFHHPRRIPMVDISVGNEFVAEVEESGFLAQDHDKQGQPFRWTTGHAKLVIPIDRAHPPQGLYVHLWPYRPANAEAGWLQLLVNQREMCGKEITRDQWQRTFDLGGMALGDEVVVEILSDTF